MEIVYAINPFLFITTEINYKIHSFPILDLEVLNLEGYTKFQLEIIFRSFTCQGNAKL